jgi:hypothetical protein
MKRVNQSLILFVIVIILFPNQLSGQMKSPVTDGQERFELFKQHLNLKETSSMKDLNWQFVGPTNVSGRCTDVEVVTPKGGNYTIYVAAASGGVWKTVNEGTSWVPIFDQDVTTSIGDIALDPNDPNTLWVGTGEANIFRSSQNGAGMYKTTDGGQTWEHMGLENTMTISRIIIDPTNINTVYI